MTADPGRAAVPMTTSPVVGQDAVLEIRDLSVVYRTPGGDVRAVDQVNLSLATGEVVGLCGESGSGKSTLVYGASRLLRAPALITGGGLLNSFPSLRGPRRDLTGIPGSPPDLRSPPPGCPFLPRCAYGTSACEEIDMHLLPVATSKDPDHVTACPFVLPETPAPQPRGAQHEPAGEPPVKDRA